MSSTDIVLAHVEPKRVSLAVRAAEVGNVAAPAVVALVPCRHVAFLITIVLAPRIIAIAISITALCLPLSFSLPLLARVAPMVPIVWALRPSTGRKHACLMAGRMNETSIAPIDSPPQFLKISMGAVPY